MAMQERLPTSIDPFRLAEAGRELRGQMATTGMARLEPMLAESGATIDVDLRFGVDNEKVRFIAGTIRGTLRVSCQRCMQPVQIDIERAVNLGIVATAADSEWLQPGYEPLIVDTPVVPLAAIVEDELLLALPMVATHQEGTCQAAAVQEQAPEASPKENPFAVLARLKTSS